MTTYLVNLNWLVIILLLFLQFAVFSKKETTGKLTIILYQNLNSAIPAINYSAIAAIGAVSAVELAIIPQLRILSAMFMSAEDEN